MSHTMGMKYQGLKIIIIIIIIIITSLYTLLPILKFW